MLFLMNSGRLESYSYAWRADRMLLQISLKLSSRLPLSRLHVCHSCGTTSWSSCSLSGWQLWKCCQSDHKFPANFFPHTVQVCRGCGSELPPTPVFFAHSRQDVLFCWCGDMSPRTHFQHMLQRLAHRSLANSSTDVMVVEAFSRPGTYKLPSICD